MAKRRGGPVLVAMSGGVDSSVAAALMVRRGYDVVGITLQIWQESQTDPRHSGCCSLGAVEDARRVAAKLKMPHYVINFKEEFRQSVIENFVDEYAAGRTPNPCVQCNKHVKFDLLLQKMRELGCETLVTGHYARIRKSAQGEYRLMLARGDEKDQSYVLYMLGQKELSVSKFPMGEFASKSDARALARELGLHLADKPDSQEICFVSEAGGYREFLRRTRPEAFAEGEVVDSEGRVVGHHEGLSDFTVGQRRGIGVATKDPLYVLRLEPASNRVVIGSDDDLLTREVPLRDLHFPTSVSLDEGLPVLAKIRYNMAPKAAVLYGGSDPNLVFRKPVRAVTPGQIAVAYRGATVIAGGTIK